MIYDISNRIYIYIYDHLFTLLWFWFFERFIIQKITKKSHQSFPNAPDSFASCKEITLLPRHKHSTGNPKKEGARGSVYARGFGVAVGTKQRWMFWFLQCLWVTLSYNRSLNQKKIRARNQLHCTSCKGTFWSNASLISPETSCDCPKSIKYTKKTRQSQPI